MSGATASRLNVMPPLAPGAWMRSRARRPLPFPLEDERCRVFAFGRHALWHGVRALGLGAGDEVLVPAYHHGSEIEALERASLTCRWYAGDERLQPSEQELDALLGPRVRALLITHYLGFPQDAARWRRWCDRHGLLLLEDAAQAWLATRDGEPVGRHGDLAIFCLYKMIGISEGAALVSRTPPEQSALDPRLGVEALGRRHGAWLIQRSALAERVTRRWRVQVVPSAAADRDLGDPASGPWRSIELLLPRLADPAVAEVRRRNYAFLLERLGEQVPAPFDVLPAGASPFTFPIHVERKREALERLAAAGVRGLEFWRDPHPSLPAGRFPALAERRSTTVGLPVHQELRRRDLDRIAAAARS